MSIEPGEKLTDPFQSPTQDLWVTYEGIDIPHSDCNKTPQRFKKKEDKCHVWVNVTDGQISEDIRFDRHGDEFILSATQKDGNGKATRRMHWFTNQHGTSHKGILRVMTVLGKFLPTDAVKNSNADDRRYAAAVPLMFAKYIVQGKAQNPLLEDISVEENIPMAGSEFLAMWLQLEGSLDAEATSIINPVFGVLRILQADPSLNALEKERVFKLLEVNRYAPQYKEIIDFVSQDISQAEDKAVQVGEQTAQEGKAVAQEGGTTTQSDAEREKYLETLKSFLAQLVIHLEMGGAFPKEGLLIKAALAYSNLTGKNLCRILEKFEKQPQHSFKLGEEVLRMCRELIGDEASHLNQEVRFALTNLWRSPDFNRKLVGALPENQQRFAKFKQQQWDKALTQIRLRALRSSRVIMKQSGSQGVGNTFQLKVVIDAKKFKQDILTLLEGKKEKQKKVFAAAALGFLRVFFYNGHNNKGTATAKRHMRSSFQVESLPEYPAIPVELSPEIIQQLEKQLLQELRKVSLLPKRPIKQGKSDSLTNPQKWTRAQIGLGASAGVFLVAGPILARGISQPGGGLPLHSTTPSGRTLLIRQTPTASQRRRAAGLGLVTAGATVGGCALGSLVNRAKLWNNDRQRNTAGVVGCLVGSALGFSAAMATAAALGGRDNHSEVMDGPAMPPEDPGQKNPVDENGP